MHPLSYTFPIEALVGLALLGLAAVLLRFSSDRQARGPLAAFLGLVGFNHLAIGLVNTAHFLPADVHAAWRPGLLFAYHAADVLQVLDAPALVLALATVAYGRLRPWLVAACAVLALALFAVAAFTVPPKAWETYSTVLSAGVTWLFAAVYLAGFAFLTVRHARETLPLRRDRLGDLTVALGAVTLTRVALAWHGQAAAPDAETLWLMVGTVAGLAAAAFVGAWAASLARSRRAVARTHARLALAVAAVAGLWLVGLEPALAPVAGGLLYVGRWLVFAAVLSAGIHRLGLLEVGERGERWLWRCLATASVAAFTFLLWAIVAGAAGADPLRGLVASAVLALVVAGLLHAIDRSRPVPAPDPRARREAVYRAHLEMGTAPAELARMRDRLGIPEEDARRLARAVADERGALASTEGALAPGALLAGRYRVESLLGVGAFGRTFLGVDQAEGGRVVLKEILRGRAEGDRSAQARLRGEVEAVLRAEHPNLVRFRGLERLRDGHVLVLEHVEGPTLRERLAQGPLGAKESARLAAALLHGLAALHAQGVAHGDVKPENVVLRGGRDPVLLDFGSARVVGGRTRRDAQGTQGYLAPERRKGGPPSVAADLYAAACVAWECATGTLPPEGDVPAPLRTALRRALEADPARRWPDAARMAEALRQPRHAGMGGTLSR